jgi:YD repeat-containing protein
VLPLIKKRMAQLFSKTQREKQPGSLKITYMTDAKGNYSEKVSLNLREENGKTFVDVVADQVFLKNPETQYPVTIDPTIDSWNVLRDNFVASSFPDSVFSSNTYMHTGYNSYFGTTRALLRFYLPALPSDSVIDSATFNAYQTRNDGQQVSVDLHRVSSDWPSSATWNSQPSTATTKESTVTSNTYNAYWSWDITSLAKYWYNGVQANYGMMLKQQNETTSPYRTFTSVNNGINTPRLTVNYRVEAIGLESFWTNTEEGVNPANGNLVYRETDVQIPGRGPEVSLTRTFNSRKSSFKGLFGYGWISNLEQTLVDSGSGPITLIDEDNTRHIFGEKVGGGYEAAGGVYLDLVKNTDGTYTITATDGTKTNFNTSGKIRSITDTNGNTITFVYDASGKLTKIQDASGRATSIAFATNGYVSSVTDPAGRITSYSYDASGNMTNVTNPEGKVTTFSYDTDHNLTGVTDARSIKTTVGYDTSDRVTSISRPLTINGVAGTSKTTYAYDTANLVTTVTDGEGKRVDYTTNANGNVVQTTQNPLDAASKTVTTFTYDNKNNLTKVVEPNTNKANGTAAYVYTYDPNGNITGVQLPENQNSTFEYDSNNNLVKEQDFSQNVSTNDYDNKNNQTESTDPNVQTSASRYDANGNLLYSTHPMSAADNLLANSGFELDQNTDSWPDGWTKMMQPNTTATYGWSNTSKFGKKAISISNPTGWAIVSSEKVKYEAGDQFIASAYIKNENTANSALIKIEYFNAQGTPLPPTSYSFGLKGTHDWTRVQAVVSDVPDQTDTILVSFGLNAGAGTAYFDGVQLEKGTTLAAYNLVENSSYERPDSTNASLPENWGTSGNLSVNDKIIQNVNPGDDNVYIGKSSFQMTGEAGKNKHLKQTINLSGDANTQLTLSGWAKQAGANPNGGPFEMQVVVNYTDGTKGYNFGNEFDKNVQDWQHVPAFVKPTKAFNSLDVYYHFNNQSGTDILMRCVW